MPKGKNSKHWVDETETLTRDRIPPEVSRLKDLSAAKRTFRTELTPSQQMMLVQEIVATRSAELCRAYDNVVDVAGGYGRRRKRNGQIVVRRVPCVTFLVRRKWRSEADKEKDKSEQLPSHLFAYWTVARKRKLCAVPTDVESASDYSAVAPQGDNTNVAITDPRSNRYAFGTVACAVARPGVNKWYALSCRHVFSLSALYPNGAGYPMQVRLSTRGGPILARTTSLRGKLTGTRGKFSFDAQLSEVAPSQVVNFKRTLKGLRINGIAKNPSDIPDKFVILPPVNRSKPDRRNPIKIDASFVRFWPNKLLPYSAVGNVMHRYIMEVSCRPFTIKGDSGAPAVSKDGKTFLGMNIAGGRGISYLIPAWQLIEPQNFNQSANNMKWKIRTV